MNHLTTFIHKSRITIASGAALLLAAPVALAATGEDPIKDNLLQTGQAINPNVDAAESSLPIIIGNIIRAALGLLGVVMVVLIIYAGYLYLTAAGDDDKVEKAKHTIKNAIIGAVLIFTAYAITNFVVDALTGAMAG